MTRDKIKITIASIFIAFISALAVIGIYQKGQDDKATFGDTINVLPAFKIVGNAILPRVATLDFAVGGTASSTADLSLDPTNNTLNIRFLNCSANANGGALTADANGLITCSDDNSGSGSGTSLQAREGYSGTFLTVASLSFNAPHFILNSNGTHASLSLDWGTGGPASLSQDETISGNWVNTANPWADNEVVDTITASNYLLLTGGTLSGNLVGTNASLSGNLEVVGYTSLSKLLVSQTSTTGNAGYIYRNLDSGSTDSPVLRIFNDSSTDDQPAILAYTDSNNGGVAIKAVTNGSNATDYAIYAVNDTNFAHSGTIARLEVINGTDTATVLNLVNAGTGNALNVDNAFYVNGTGRASSSFDLEVAGYSSASKYFGSAFAGLGGTNGCAGASDTLNYNSTTGLFSCGSDATGAGSPGGSDTHIQFNDASAFGGVASFTFAKTTAKLTLDGTASISGAITVGASTSLREHPSLKFIDWQTESGGDYTLMRIKAPKASSKEATLSLLIDVDQDNSGINEEFIDFYNEDYADSHQAGIRTVYTGTGEKKKFIIGHWDTITTKNEGNNLTLYPYGVSAFYNGLNVGLGASATVSYSRFGTSTTGHSLSASNDVLISGNMEVDGVAYIDGVLTIPNGTAPTVDADGEIAVDTSGFGQLVYYASGSAHTLTDEKTMMLSIGSTSFSSFASRSLGYMFRGRTIKRIQCKVASATSVQINLSSNGTSDMDTLTCATTNTFDDGSIANSTVTKGSDLVLERRTISGEADYLQITITYADSRE